MLLKDLIFFPNIFLKNFSNLSLGCTERSSRRSSDRVRRGKIDHEASQVTDVNNYKYAAYALVLFSWTIYIIETAVLSPSFYFSRGHRIFVATWNVAGKSPPSYLNLEDWLQTSPPADIYVLGYAQLIKNFVFLTHLFELCERKYNRRSLIHPFGIQVSRDCSFKCW